MVRGTDTEDSDVDLLVDLPRSSYVLVAQVRDSALSALGADVDLFTEPLLQDGLREKVLAEAVTL